MNFTVTRNLAESIDYDDDDGTRWMTLRGRGSSASERDDSQLRMGVLGVSVVASNGATSSRYGTFKILGSTSYLFLPFDKTDEAGSRRGKKQTFV